MNFLKKVIIWVFLLAFLVFSGLAIAGGMGWIQLVGDSLFGFLAAIVTQLVGGIFIAFKTPDFFREDPVTIGNLQQEHKREIEELNKLHGAQLAAKLNELEARNTEVADLKGKIFITTGLNLDTIEGTAAMKRLVATRRHKTPADESKFIG